MVPWPIALLTLFYGVVAAVSASTAWKILVGTSHKSLVWTLAWLVVSGGAMFGLPLFKAWGRWCAIIAAVWLTISTVAVAAWFVMAGEPGIGGLVTFSALIDLVAIRYLRRPVVKALFSSTRTT